jgi:Arc/MetJ-type ribon-helix-helix transcriptional regulator
MARQRQKRARDLGLGKRLEEWVKRGQGRMPSRSEAGKALVRSLTTRRA